MVGATPDGLGSRFVLNELAGEGAFGEVHRATDLQSGETVAIKRLVPSVRDPMIAERFEREARLLARIDHPHVVGYVDFGHGDDGRPWLALEWLDGTDLSVRQKRDPLTVSEAAEVVRQAALGLEALHDLGIVHRDLKPSNFFLRETEDGSLCVKLIDLGIARSTDDDVMLTTVGLRIGTPAYMSPEQAGGDVQVGPQSDIYSLGVVLFELITGRRPFTGSDPLALLAKIVLDTPPRLSRVTTGLPPELDALIESMLSKGPGDRPKSAPEVAAALVAMTLPDRPTGQGADDLPTQQELAVPAPELAERRVVTTIFGALPRPSTAEQAAEVRKLVERFGASVHRLLGRRFVAAFGLTRTRGDEALRAARAALAARSAFPGLRLAIATGWAVSDHVTVSGQVIDRGAAALERAGDDIVVDPETGRRLSSHFEVESFDARHVLVGERPVSTVAEPRLLGRETRLIERDRELDDIEDLFLSTARDSRPGAVIVTGAAGMGKSRLRYELMGRLADLDEAPAFVMLRSDPTLSGVPLGVFSHSLRRRARIEPRMSDVEKRGRVRAWATDAGLEAPMEFLCELLRVSADHSTQLQAVRADPNALAAALRDTAVEVLRALARRGPIAILFEDIQWSDPTTVDVLAWALDTLHEMPLFVAAFGRSEVSERFPKLWSAAQPLELALRPLSKRASERLIRDVLPDADAELHRAIAERAAGNPLFLEELVRAATKGETELPVAIQSAFQMRLDELPLPAKKAALAASVFGRAVWSEGVGALLPGASTNLNLDVLTHWEILADRPRSRFPGTRELVFRHAILRDVAYGMLGDEDRARFHGAAAEWLAQAGERDHAVLAHHHHLAGRDDEAASHYFIAARSASEEGAFATAHGHAERALELRVGDTVASDLRMIAAGTAHKLGRYDESLAQSAAGLKLARDPVLRLRLVAARTLTLRRSGRTDEALSLAGEALAAFAELDMTPVLRRARADVAIEHGWSLYNAGRAGAALELVDRALDGLDEDAPELTALVTSTLHLRARSHHGLGRLDTSLRLHQEAVDRAEARSHFWRGEGARYGLGQVLLALGRLGEAERELRTARDRGRSYKLPSTEGSAELYLGLVHLRRGDLDGAQMSAQRAAEVGARLGAEWLEAAGHALIAHALAASGAAVDVVRPHLDAIGAAGPWRVVAASAVAWSRARVGDSAGSADAVEIAGTLDMLQESGEAHELAAIACLAALEGRETAAHAELSAYLREDLRRRLAHIEDAAIAEELRGAAVLGA